MIATSTAERQKLRAAGKMLAEILNVTALRAVPGATALELNEFAHAQIHSRGATPIFLNYQSEDSSSPYPATICISINNEVVHGIPTQEKVVAEKDVVSLDLGLSLEGYVVDAAVTKIIGDGDDDAVRLVGATREALYSAIGEAKPGVSLGDIGATVSQMAKKYNLTVVRDLGGHGTGRSLHEPPFIANFGKRGAGEKLQEGMVLAIEPIFTLGSGAIELDPDGWTYTTRDHSRAAHFEHTILVTAEGAEILTS